eukprot:scaffold13965_cov101-Cylindrotheca_fusiformis.AAC.1
MKYFAVALSLLLVSSVALSEAAGALRGPSKPDGEAGEAVTLPNGISCRMCPDDDNYFWPDEWTLRHGDPDVYTDRLKEMKKKKQKTLFWWRKLEDAADAAKVEAERRLSPMASPVACVPMMTTISGLTIGLSSMAGRINRLRHNSGHTGSTHSLVTRSGIGKSFFVWEGGHPPPQ